MTPQEMELSGFFQGLLGDASVGPSMPGPAPADPNLAPADPRSPTGQMMAGQVSQPMAPPQPQQAAAPQPQQAAAPQFVEIMPDGSVNPMPTPQPAQAPLTPATRPEPVSNEEAVGAVYQVSDTAQAVQEEAPEELFPYSNFLANTGQAVAGRLMSPIADMVTGGRPERDMVDYRSGLRNADFRARMSMADTPAERAQVMNQMIGEGYWYQDEQGEYIVLPNSPSPLTEGLDRPTAVDESGLTMYDALDLAGIGGPLMGSIAGAKGGALVGAASGNPIGVAAGTLIGAGLGGYAGSLAQEAGEHVGGSNLQSLGEVNNMAVKEGLWSMAGEGGGQLLSRGLGRVAQRMPFRADLGAQRQADIDLATSWDVRPGMARMLAPNEAPGRLAAMTHNIFGNAAKDADNFAKLNDRYLAQLREFGEQAVDPTVTGNLVKQGIQTARQNLREIAGKAYGAAEDALKGQGDAFPTWRLKQVARDLVGDLPRGAGGETLFTSPQTRQFVDSVQQLPDVISGQQWQRIKSSLYDPMSKSSLQDGINVRDAKQLYGAANQMLDDGMAEAARTGNVNLLDGLNAYKSANDLYKQQIRQFDAAILKRLVRNPDAANYIPAEQVTGTLLRPNNAYNAREVMGALQGNKPAQDAIGRSVMEEMVGTKIVPDPKQPGGQLFDAKGLRKHMDAIGEDTLSTLLGPQAYGNLEKFATVAELANRVPSGAGSLVAAGIAARPLANIGRIMSLGFAHKLFNNPVVADWLTRGVQYSPGSREAAHFANQVTGLTTMLSEDPEAAPEYFDSPEFRERLEQYIPGARGNQYHERMQGWDLRDENDMARLYGSSA